MVADRLASPHFWSTALHTTQSPEYRILLAYELKNTAKRILERLGIQTSSSFVKF